MTDANSPKDVGSPPHPMPDLEFDPGKAALTIIDMQYCDANRHYGLGKILAASRPEVAQYYFDRLENVVVPNQLKLLNFFREKGLRIVYIVLGARLPDFSDLTPFWRKKAFIPEKELGISGARVWFHAGEFEYSLLPELKPQENELVIQKTTSGAFSSSNLDLSLRNVGIETLVIGGVVTDGCVLATTIAAADLGYTCILVDDACAAHEQQNHDAVLRILGGSRAWVMSTQQVTDVFSEQLSA